jgi:hypothetical protein
MTTIKFEMATADNVSISLSKTGEIQSNASRKWPISGDFGFVNEKKFSEWMNEWMKNVIK